MATLNDLIGRFNSLEAQFQALKADLIAFAQGQTTSPGAAPPPLTVVAPNPLYEQNLNHLLTHVRAVGNVRVDPVVGADCPNTVRLLKTGHVLSEARPDLGEMFVGYCQRVADQATGGNAEKVLGTVGSLFLGTDTYFRRASGKPYQRDGSNWPAAADCFFNMRAYMTDAELAQEEKSKADWQAVYEAMKNNANKPPVPPPVVLPPGETPL